MKEYHLKDFTLYTGNDSLEALLENLIGASYSQVFVLTDDQTEKYCLPILNKHLLDFHPIRIPSGEQHKTLQTAQVIWNELQKHNAGRRAVMINLGGGVVGDIGGFCASTFKRGFDFINVPTTLLGMVDSSIGGKVGIDLNGVKNAIGLFHHPRAVYINPAFLKTLPQAEITNGFAEIIKHALIADNEYWEKLRRLDVDHWEKMAPLIPASVKIKLRVVRKDPFERDKRKLLNFGHTVGHAIESWSLRRDSKPLRHGEAVAIGMICEAWLSREILGLNGKDVREIADFILRRYKKYSLKNVLSPELIALMRQDKKNEGETINFTLLKRIGKGSINHTADPQLITRALQFYENL